MFTDTNKHTKKAVYTREDLDNYYLSYNDGEPIRKSYWQSLIYRIQLVEVYQVGGAYRIEDRTQLAEMSANLDVKFKCGDYDISPTYNSVHNHWDFQFHLFAAPYMYMGDSRYEAFNQDSNSISFWFQVESITAKS